MAENIVTNSNHSTEEKYILLLKQLKGLLSNKDNFLSNLSNLTASLKQSFDKISWVGFYLFDGKRLYLGPFQGSVACTEIEMGKGVCGTSAEKSQSIIVPDVDKFPGHIVCDAGSRSEIVVPIIKNGELFGVLDIDSYEYNSFDEIDRKYLEKICTFLSKEILN
ncbi:MAG: GAF domain-containing protein [Ignavibacteriaceae bacterium]|nr:GAF domain-containing protein [Ignavibacteriaceae bacterium]